MTSAEDSNVTMDYHLGHAEMVIWMDRQEKEGYEWELVRTKGHNT